MTEEMRGAKEDIERYVNQSRIAYERFSSFSLRDRMELIQHLREALLLQVEEFAKMEWEETQMGVLTDKEKQIRAAIVATPGASTIQTGASSDEEGLVLEEYFPYGIAVAIHPVNHPVASIINTTIMLLSAGNSMIHLGPMRAAETCLKLVNRINEIIYEVCGIDNLVQTMPENRRESNLQFLQHPDVALVLVTGGEDLVRMVRGIKKRVIIAGPANPVAIVDTGADLQKAAADIVEAVAFDHNLLCTSEKAVVVVKDALEEFLTRLLFEGSLFLTKEQVLQLENTVFNPEMEVEKGIVGQSVSNLMQLAKISYDSSKEYRMIAFLADLSSPFVLEEVAAPILPIVVAEDFDEALELAKSMEQGANHTASIHSKNIDHLSRASRELQTAIFVKNGSSLYGAGLKGNGAVCFQIANVSGEGVISPKDLVRKKKCILLGSFERH